MSALGFRKKLQVITYKWIMSISVGPQNLDAPDGSKTEPSEWRFFVVECIA
jgi:hypothetical protein